MKNFFKAVLTIAATAFLTACFTLTGCFLFGNDMDILSVKERSDKLRREMTKTLGEGFIARDVTAVKNLFCPKSQALPDVAEQIEKTFSFIDGKVVSYKTGSRGYESYGTEYGTVTDYEFDSSVFLTTDAGKEYGLTFRVFYISEDPVKGMTAYSLNELHRDDAEYCHAGYYWASPYDDEIGRLAATLITGLGAGNADAVKNLLCEQTKNFTETDEDIRAAIDAFEGKPLFTERADGLYNYSDAEEDFTVRVIINDTIKKDGEIVSVWLSVDIRGIRTDADRDYDLEFAVYLQNDEAPQKQGLSYFALSHRTGEEIVSVGDRIHD